MAQKPPGGTTRPAMRQAQRMFAPDSTVNADGSPRATPSRARAPELEGQTDIYDQILDATDDTAFWFES